MTIKSKNDIKASLALQRYLLKKAFIMFLVIELFFIVLAIVDLSLLDVAIYYFFFVLLFFPALLLFSKKALKKNKFVGDNVINEFTFGEMNLTVRSTRDDAELGNVNLDRGDIKKIKETKKYIFLFLTSNQAYAINKTGLTAQEIETINGFKLNFGAKKQKTK